MKGLLRILLGAAVALPPSLAVGLAGGEAAAQKPGGILRIYHRDSPGNMSILENGTISVLMPMMAVMNNLVVFDPKQKQNRLDNIVPDLAESWSVNGEGNELTFKLRQGVKWHDGKPFTAADVKCTFDLLQGKAKDKLRLNAREAWWTNLNEVTADNEYQATFHLKRPQPSFLALLAAGFTPVYPCHVPAAQMRQHPIGTGPFKFVEFKPNQSIKVAKNPDYWKKGRPYLDGIEYTIIPNRSTAILAFIAGNFDMSFPYEVTVPMLKDVQAQLPQAVCEVTPLNFAPNLLVTEKPPFDNRQLRKAVAMTLDRQALIDILGEGQGDIGTATLPAPEGQWAMPKEMRDKLPGYDPDIAKSRAEAQKIMQSLGYGPEKRLSIKIASRNIPDYRDAASIVADQLKHIYIDAELELVETANWLPKLVRGDFVMAQSVAGAGIDDPDQTFYENYGCKSNRNYTKYCDPEVEKLVDQQSMETDIEKRRRIVWEMDRRLQEAVVRPVMYYMRKATCTRPEVKGLTVMVNSSYNGWRMEDVWLDK
jgi:peptide/nickel transport system substrate-binding protein